MTPEDRQNIRERMTELVIVTQNEPTAGAIMLLADRIVGVLDGILSALRAIEDKLDAETPVKKEKP